jgi:hypothetical protein
MVTEIITEVRNAKSYAVAQMAAALDLAAGDADKAQMRSMVSAAKLALEDYRRAIELARGMIKAQRAAGF